jgi:hypothetical protein
MSDDKTPREPFVVFARTRVPVLYRDQYYDIIPRLGNPCNVWVIHDSTETPVVRCTNECEESRQYTEEQYRKGARSTRFGSCALHRFYDVPFVAADGTEVMYYADDEKDSVGFNTYRRYLNHVVANGGAPMITQPFQCKGG